MEDAPRGGGGGEGLEGGREAGKKEKLGSFISKNSSFNSSFSFFLSLIIFEGKCLIYNLGARKFVRYF